MLRLGSKLSIKILEFISQFFYQLVRDNRSKIASRIRKRIHHTKCNIDTGVTITNWENFSCGDDCAIYHGTYILNHSGRVVIGNNSHLGAMCYLNVCYGNLKIGNDVAIGPGTKIIVYSNHYQLGKKVTDERIIKDVKLGNNIFIGANSTIIPGSIIADNVVVGAGSVIMGNLDPNSVYAGIPCRKIKEHWYE